MLQEFYHTFVSHASPHAYGVFTINGELKGDKVEGRASTVAGIPTEAVIQDHLDGKVGIGSILTNADGMSLTGVIDVDGIYNKKKQKEDILRALRTLDLPLRATESKSGGLHLWLILKAPIKTVTMRNILANYVRQLGLPAKTEIFPKQDISADTNPGNWINLPFFGEDRRGYIDGKFTTAEVWLSQEGVDEPQINQLVTAPQPEPTTLDVVSGDNPFYEGPPCLQHLYDAKIGEGDRNKGVFAIAIFCRKKYGEDIDDFEEPTMDLNRAMVMPQLPMRELKQVTKSINKKNYSYPCKDSPIAQHCNRAVCETRRFGVGAKGQPEKGLDDPKATGAYIIKLEKHLGQVNNYLATFTLTTEGGSVLQNEVWFYNALDLTSQIRYQNRVFHELSIKPKLLKQTKFDDYINEISKNQTIHQGPDYLDYENRVWEEYKKFVSGLGGTPTEDDADSGAGIPFAADLDDIFGTRAAVFHRESDNLLCFAMVHFCERFGLKSLENSDLEHNKVWNTLRDHALIRARVEGDTPKQYVAALLPESITPAAPTTEDTSWDVTDQ